MNNLKRVLIIALCSILCICTIPRFSLRSEAASTATYALYETLLNLSGYLTTRGYSIVHEHGSSIPSISELRDMSYEKQSQFLLDIASKLDEFGASHDLPDAGQQFVNRMKAAALTGAITLSPSLRNVVDLWLEYTISSGEVIVGTTTKGFYDFVYDEDKVFNITYRGSASSFHANVVIGKSSIPILTLSDQYLYFLPESIDEFEYNALTNTYTFLQSSGPYALTQTVEYDGKTYQINFIRDVTSTNNFSPFVYTGSGKVLELYLNGYFDDLTVPGNNLVVNQLTDTSNIDVLTSTNEIESDSSVAGPTTIYLPSQSEFESLIDSYNQNSLTYEDFIKALGISVVASDATVTEKEDALSEVVTPTDDYLWFTKTQWGADSLEETRKASASTRAEEDSLADSIANTLNGGSDPEPDDDGKSRGKGLLALLLLGLGVWNTPIIAGDGTPSSGGTDDGSTDGSGDTSGYLQESIAGMAVAGGIVEDLFSAAGGSDGYGLTYTVGASFVIFSVIIGAANYFGALFSGSDTKQNIKSSGKQTRSNSPSRKTKKGG